MDTRIICKGEFTGKNDFYMIHEGVSYYLFSQDYHMSVNSYYKKGVNLDQARDYRKCRTNPPLQKTMEKIFLYIRYVEKENGITVLTSTRKKDLRRSSGYKRKHYAAA